jgi:hypothetical protein
VSGQDLPGCWLAVVISDDRGQVLVDRRAIPRRGTCRWGCCTGGEDVLGVRRVVADSVTVGVRSVVGRDALPGAERVDPCRAENTRSVARQRGQRGARQIGRARSGLSGPGERRPATQSGQCRRCCLGAPGAVELTEKPGAVGAPSGSSVR